MPPPLSVPHPSGRGFIRVPMPPKTRTNATSDQGLCDNSTSTKVTSAPPHNGYIPTDAPECASSSRRHATVRGGCWQHFRALAARLVPFVVCHTLLTVPLFRLTMCDCVHPTHFSMSFGVNRGGACKRGREESLTGEVVLSPTLDDNPSCLFLCLCRLVGKPCNGRGIAELRLQVATQISFHSHWGTMVNHSYMKQWATSLGYDSVHQLVQRTHVSPLRPGSCLDIHIVHEFTGLTIWVLDELDRVLLSLGDVAPSLALRLVDTHYRLVEVNPEAAEDVRLRIKTASELRADRTLLLQDILRRYIRSTARAMTVSYHRPIWENMATIGLLKGVVVVHQWQELSGRDARATVAIGSDAYEMQLPCWARFISLRLELNSFHASYAHLQEQAWNVTRVHIALAARHILEVEDPCTNIWQRTQSLCLQGALTSKEVAMQLHACWCVHTGDELRPCRLAEWNRHNDAPAPSLCLQGGPSDGDQHLSAYFFVGNCPVQQVANFLSTNFGVTTKVPADASASQPGSPPSLSPTIRFNESEHNAVPLDSRSNTEKTLLVGGAVKHPFPVFYKWKANTERGFRRVQITTPNYSVFEVCLPRDPQQAVAAVAQHLALDERWLSFNWRTTRHLYVEWRAPPTAGAELDRIRAIAEDLIPGAPTRAATSAKTVSLGARVSRQHGLTALTSKPALARAVMALNQLLSKLLPATRWTSIAITRAATVAAHSDKQNQFGRTTYLMALDNPVWFMSHSDLGPTVVEDGVATPVTWNELMPGCPALFDSTRSHAILACSQALLLVLYSPSRKLREDTLVQLKELHFPCDAQGGELPLDLEARDHTLRVTTPAGDTHIVPWPLPQMACHLTGWLCKHYRRPELAWELWDKPSARQADELQ
eukprot:6328373-Amphidinium_carterae.2